MRFEDNYEEVGRDLIGVDRDGLHAAQSWTHCLVIRVASEGYQSRERRMSRTQRGTLVATALGLFMIFLDALIVNVALPDMQAEFGVGEDGLQWVVTAYSIGMAALMMTSATLADRWGRRRVYIGGIIVFAAASAACGFAPDLGTLSISRGVQGMAAAATNVTSLALVSAAFVDHDLKARAIGIWTAIAAGALALGPSLGGVMTQFLGWPSVFFVNVAIGIVALVLTGIFVDESRDSRTRGLDPLGQILYVATIGGFSWAVIEGPHKGWTSAGIVAAAGVFVIAFVVFVSWELRTTDPMMDVRLFANRIYTLAIIVILVSLLSIYGMLLIVTQFLQNVRGFSPLVTGAVLLPFALGQMILAPQVGSWMATVGARRLLLTGLTLLPLGLAIGVVGMQTPVAVLVLCLVLTGAAAAFTMTPSTTIAMKTVPEDRAGMASGIMSAQRAIGSTVGYAVLGTILAAWLGATLSTELQRTIPDQTERAAVTEQIINNANPRAVAAEIGPGRPIPHASTATRQEIVDEASSEFVRGSQLALAFAALVSLATLVAVWRGVPREGQQAPASIATIRPGASPGT